MPGSASSTLLYRGRFAPSPTGPLHMGSLAAAAASYLRARQASGEWLLRIEDIDPPREVTGASDSFLSTLEAFGFEWDGPVYYQSERFELYRSTLAQLIKTRNAYRCVCSRRAIREAIEKTGGPTGVYPGTCLATPPKSNAQLNVRLAANNQLVCFTDVLQGKQQVQFGQDLGDFVIWRKNDLPSYQLAATVDDLEMGITEVVRGIDLLHETAGQIVLREALASDELPNLPNWVHIPMLVHDNGDKLSKQTGAPPINVAHAAQQLCIALEAIGLHVEEALRRAALSDIWNYAIEQWQPNILFSKKFAALD